MTSIPRRVASQRHQARDPLVYSIASNLFWKDIMMKHGIFFAQLMLCAELDARAGKRRNSSVCSLASSSSRKAFAPTITSRSTTERSISRSASEA